MQLAALHSFALLQRHDMADQKATNENALWQPQPAAAAIIEQLLQKGLQRSAWLTQFGQRLLTETGTRLVDWVDHFAISETMLEGSLDASRDRLRSAGYSIDERQADSTKAVQNSEESLESWMPTAALLPPIHMGGNGPLRVAIKVESVADFVAVHQLGGSVEILGRTHAALRKAVIDRSSECEVWVVERHGHADWEPDEPTDRQVLQLLEHQDRFRVRARECAEDGLGFAEASRLISAAVSDLGVDRTCDLFFAAERRYWQDRNRAAQIQKGRQDRLGLGWANHDHHTYRSSRKHFADLVRVLEQLGFVCRESFFAGEQAGWGAQVLEHPVCGIVIFADVDLSADEVMGDFAHEGLTPRSQLGTVGLWCQLHGEAFLQAGLHHLECQFDFEAARNQLSDRGVASMAPFTDFAFLKQSFTEGEIWPVNDKRLQVALEQGFVTEEQAQRFRDEGALGSHLEVLERNDGYKGFNQTGISDIIRKTDPRAYASS